MHGLAGKHDGPFLPQARHAGHSRVGELGAGLAQQQVIELGAVRAADQMNGGDAPAGVELSLMPGC
ncbi:hypothetical protein [Caballeronia sp. GAFFF1]|uniref:hypothetical protein n=1 Tax=Caballeronia sp. GAFFF1 TaxID=2921779 RepID=UPI0032EEAF57